MDSSALPKVSIKVWSFSNPGRLKIISDYMVDKYVRVIIGEESDPPRKLYVVIDPYVSARELRELERVASELIYVLDRVPDEKTLQRLLEERRLARPEIMYLIIRELAADRFGPLDPLIRDPSLENIECTGPHRPVTVLHNTLGRLETNLVFDEEELDKLVMKLANKAGKSISKANPKIDNARLPGGHRLACTFMSEISETSSFVIRKFPSEPWTITKLMLSKTLSPEIAAWLWLLIEHKLPVLIVGGMGVGKTSFANALCGLIPPDKRVGTVEDVPEFNLPVKQQHWQRFFTRESFTLDGKGSIDLFQLVKEMLRYQVEYLIVNEIRGEEAKVWFQQISSGHGGITTIHADDFSSAISRLKDLGVDVSSLTSLHGLVYLSVFERGSGRFRRVREVADFELEEGTPKFRILFRYRPSSDEWEMPQVEELAQTRSVKKMLSFSSRIHNEDDFIKEYNLRVEFLKWLLRRAEANKEFLTPKKLISVFEKFYTNPHFFKEAAAEEPQHFVKVTSEREGGLKIVDIRKSSGDRPGVKVINIRKVDTSRDLRVIKSKKKFKKLFPRVKI